MEKVSLKRAVEEKGFDHAGEIENIAGVPLDHSFLTYKKELLEYGWQVKKIHMKEKCVEFIKN